MLVNNDQDGLMDNAVDQQAFIYKRGFNTYRPVLKGKQPGYEPVTEGDTCRIVIMTLFVYVICSAMILVGLSLVKTYGTVPVVFTGFCVVCSFVLLLVIGMFISQDKRIVKEEEMMELKLKEMGLDKESLKAKKIEEKRLRELKRMKAEEKALALEDVHIGFKEDSKVHFDFKEKDVCIFVSDLRGFTSTTRRWGITHMASIIIRMRQLCLPIFNNRGATYIGTEADNFIVIFPNVTNAVMAALEMQAVVKEYQHSLMKSKQHFKIQLNGVGLHCGKGVVVDKLEKLHGEVYNHAYHIGEDLCSGGNIIISENVKERIENNPDFIRAKFCQVKEEDNIYCLEGDVKNLDFSIVPVEDARYLSPNLLPLVSRHGDLSRLELQDLDNRLKAEYLQQYTCMMYEFELEEIEAKLGADAGVQLKFDALNFIRPELVKCNGIELEDILWTFEDPVDALRAVEKIKSCVVQFNNTRSEDEKIKIKGYGIHKGTMLFIQGTDVHWGDPVNTSSKLGQDLADNGDCLVMPCIYEAVRNSEIFPFFDFEQKTLRRSKVDFICYKVTSNSLSTNNITQKYVRVSYEDKDVCVLVSDLSGFTTTTRKWGITHMASIIIRMRQLCLPILMRRGAIFVSTEADNFIVIFSDSIQAVLAATEMQQVLIKYQESLPSNKEHFKVKLNGVGLHCGKGVQVDKLDKIHGAVYNHAYDIGEEQCSGGNVVISQVLKDRIEHHNLFNNVEFVDVTEEGADHKVYEVRNTPKDLKFEVVSPLDDRFLHKSLLKLTRRHDMTMSDQKLMRFDDMLKKTYLRTFTVLMYEFLLEEIEESQGAEFGLLLKFKALDLVRPILSKFNGIELEDSLWIFEDSNDAVKGALGMKKFIAKYNSQQKEHHDQIQLSGYGIHQGEMLFIEGTDVHWGDPVNTASKLGEDIAKDGQILIMPDVYENLKAREEELFDSLDFKKQQFIKSKVTFNCYNVTRKGDGHHHHEMQIDK